MRHFSWKLCSTAVLMAATLALAGCGGGGEEPTPTPTKTPVAGAAQPAATPTPASGAQTGAQGSEQAGGQPAQAEQPAQPSPTPVVERIATVATDLLNIRSDPKHQRQHSRHGGNRRGLHCGRGVG